MTETREIRVIVVTYTISYLVTIALDLVVFIKENATYVEIWYAR